MELKLAQESEQPLKTPEPDILTPVMEVQKEKEATKVTEEPSPMID